MRTMDIVERIMTTGVCPAVIRIHNADRLDAWVRDTARHHTADTCTAQKRKDCGHAPGPGTAAFARTIRDEAAAVCTCGDHR